MNETTMMTDKINIIMNNLIKEIDKYVEFVKASIIEESITQALNALMPLETTQPKSITLTGDDEPIKHLGFQLMRMDVEPPIFNLGLTIDMEQSEASDKRDYVIYVKACKTIDEIREYVFSPDFKSDALVQFRRAINNYYNKA